MCANTEIDYEKMIIRKMSIMRLLRWWYAFVGR